MNTSIHSRMVLARRVAAACGAGVLLLGAAGCGSSDPKAASAGTNGYGGAAGGGASQTRQGARPGTSGKVAALSGRTAQVQSQQDGQVAVTWTASTTFTKQVAAKLTDIGIGDCVMVSTAAQSATTPGSGSTSGTTPTAITATAVRITEKVDGTCTPTRGGQGAPGGAPPQGTGPQVQGNPEGAPPAGARPQVGGFGGAFGTVKAVSANGFVVTMTVPTAASAGSSTGGTSTEVTVTVTRATTYSTTAAGTAKDVKIGACVRADGSNDTTGAVTATRIAVTPAVNGECTDGLARFSRTSDGTSTGKAS